MVTHAFEIHLAGEIGSGPDLRQAVDRAQGSIPHAMRAYEEHERLYSLDIGIENREAHEQTTLVALAEELIQTLFGALTGPPERRIESRALAELRLRRSWTTVAPGIAVSIHSAADAHTDPGGVLLVDEPGPLLLSGAAIATWAASIDDSLEANVMARRNAEYALAIDMPLVRASDDRIPQLTVALMLATYLAGVLPAEVSGAPNLLDFRVRVGSVGRAEATARVRVWRLGLMKARSQSRVA